MTEHKRFSLFLAVLKFTRTKMIRGGGSGECSGGDGQVHVLLLGRGWRDGNVILLFLWASRGWQGRAFAVVCASPLAAALSLLFVLHAAVLKPDLHLFFRQVQVCGDLDAPQSGEVHIRGELSLQLQKLRAGEGCAHAFAALKFAVAVFCGGKKRKIKLSVKVCEWWKKIVWKPFCTCDESCKSSSTHRLRCSGTVVGQGPSTRLGISPVRGWGSRRWVMSVASTGPSDNTVSRKVEKPPWGAGASVGRDGAGTRSCKEDRSTATRLSWSGRSPASRAGGAAYAPHTGIKVGCSRSPCRWLPSKSRNPREKTSACLQKNEEDVLLGVPEVGVVRRCVRLLSPGRWTAEWCWRRTEAP